MRLRLLLRDYHTAHAPEGKASYITHRYYLSDAIFLVGLEGDEKELQEIGEALHHPAHPLYLGRRSCPPTLPLVLGLRDSGLREALLEERCLAEAESKVRGTRLLLESDSTSDGAFCRDVPLSYGPERRSYGIRRVQARTFPRSPVPVQTLFVGFATSLKRQRLPSFNLSRRLS